LRVFVEKPFAAVTTGSVSASLAAPGETPPTGWAVQGNYRRRKFVREFDNVMRHKKLISHAAVARLEIAVRIATPEQVRRRGEAARLAGRTGASPKRGAAMTRVNATGSATR
jgi:hypothetical protein